MKSPPPRSPELTTQLRPGWSLASNLILLGTFVLSYFGLAPTGITEPVEGKLEQTPPKLLSLTAFPGGFVVPGEPVRLQVRAEGEGLTIRWFHNGVPMDATNTSFGASTNELLLPRFGPAHCGRYSATISNSLGQFESGDLTLTLSSWRRTAVVTQDQTDSWHSASITADGRRMVVASPVRVLSSPDGGSLWNEYRTTNGIITTARVSADGNAVLVGHTIDLSWPLLPQTAPSDWQPDWVPVYTGEYIGYGYEYYYPSSMVCSSDGQIILKNPKLNRGMFGSFDGYLENSWNGGATWQYPEWPEEYWGSPIGFSSVWLSPSCSKDGRIQIALHSSWLNSDRAAVFLSLDAGVTWRLMTTPVLSPGSPVAVSPDGSTLVLGGLYGTTNGIYLSKDLGQTWFRTTAPDRIWTRLCLSADGQRLFASEVDAVPFGRGFIHQSMDGGRTWQWSGSPSANWRSLACSADGTQVIGASDLGIFLSPALPDSSAEDVPASASRQADGLHIRWQGQPHRTYHLLQTDQLSSSTEWLSIGAAVADAEGKFSLTSPGEKSQSFWRAVQVQ